MNSKENEKLIIQQILSLQIATTNFIENNIKVLIENQRILQQNILSIIKNQNILLNSINMLAKGINIEGISTREFLAENLEKIKVDLPEKNIVSE